MYRVPIITPWKFVEPSRAYCALVGSELLTAAPRPPTRLLLRYACTLPSITLILQPCSSAPVSNVPVRVAFVADIVPELDTEKFLADIEPVARLMYIPAVTLPLDVA